MTEVAVAIVFLVVPALLGSWLVPAESDYIASSTILGWSSQVIQIQSVGNGAVTLIGKNAPRDNRILRPGDIVTVPPHLLR